jgi:hypothetical protein
LTTWAGDFIETKEDSMKSVSGLYYEQWRLALTPKREAMTAVQISVYGKQKIKIVAFDVQFDGTGSASSLAEIAFEIQRGGRFACTEFDERGSKIGKLEIDTPETMSTLCRMKTAAFGGVVFWPFPCGEEPIINCGETLGLKVSCGHWINATGELHYAYVD